MTFLAADRLLLLAGAGVLAVSYAVLQQRRRHYAVRFSNLELLARLAPKRPGWRRHLAAAMGLAAIVSVIIGLARPVQAQQVPRDEAILMLAIDVSASMSATDVEPSRLAAAQKAATDFVAESPDGFQIGLVVFDRTARVLATPSIDHEPVLRAIANLTTGTGTAGGEALHTAVESVTATLAATEDAGVAAEGNAPIASIVMLSDGSTTVGRPIEEAAAEAAAANIPVSTISFGTASGTVMIEGEVVPVPADTDTMQLVADKTSGTAFTASSAAELEAVYDDIQQRVGYRTEQREISAWFLGAGLAALMLAVAASMFWGARFL